ncbi:beta-glucoside operon transcriptional antiterminator [Enterococcus sp. AZ194]|uniref:BglG family transcription antiterminator LicT n=1 Tax=Enterococcus sp. AZ194 TaxID=2774629 RepID=UPI003F28A629
MRINKVLNNNAVIVLDENKREQVVCGRGIAFKKKAGDWLPESESNQIFVLKDKQARKRFQQLVLEIYPEELEVTNEIIKYAKARVGKQLSENLLISLSDHIHNSIKRTNEGTILRNAMLFDIKRFYTKEFEIGVAALKIIESRLKVKLPEDEAGFLAIHFVNAELGEDLHNMVEITKIMQELSNIVKYSFNLEFDEENVYYYRFITHLKFFAQRVINGKMYEDGEEDLLEVIEHKFQAAYTCVLRIEEFIKQKYNYPLTNEEKAYLTIHIHRVVYKTKKV